MVGSGGTRLPGVKGIVADSRRGRQQEGITSAATPRREVARRSTAARSGCAGSTGSHTSPSVVKISRDTFGTLNTGSQ